MALTSAPVVGRSASHIFPQVVRVALPEGMVAIAFCVQDSTKAHDRIAQLVNEFEELALLNDDLFLERLQEVLAKEPGMQSFALVKIEGSQLFVCASGDGAVLLERNKKRAAVARGSELRMLRGESRPHDIVYCVTGPLHRLLPDVSSQSSHPSDLAEEIGLLLTNPDSEYGAAGVIIAVGKESQKHAAATVDLPEVNEHRSQFVKPAVKEYAFDMGSGSEGDLSKSSKKGRSLWLIIGLIIIVGAVVLGISVALGIRGEAAKKRQAQLDQALAPAKTLLIEAQAKKDTDIAVARKMTAEALEITKKVASEQTPKSSELQKARDLQTSLQAFADTLNEQKQLAAIAPYYDLRLIAAPFRLGSFFLSGETAYVTDQSSGKAYALQLQSKRAGAVESYESKPIRLFAGSGKALFAIGEGIQRGGKLVWPADTSWGSPGPAAWYMGNLYVTDVASGQLRKYTDASATTTELKGGESWLKDEPGISPADWTSLVIDGRVWVGTKTGTVVRFLQGKKDPFQVKGVEPKLSSAVYLALADADFLYIMEPASARILKLRKTGEFLQTWKVPVLAGAKGFAVSADGKTAYAATETLVYRIPLE